mmetsp:Transcript_36699/g.57343  ORF Transcript_36699/g.57343 Transcript_36699/m.57343 type:complete len:369 (+) Transcript_36699:51-1157(+)
MWIDLHDPFSEIPSPLFLVHVSLPLAMEKLKPRDSFKHLLHAWLELAGRIMGMRDKILPNAVQRLVPSHQAENESQPAGAEQEQENREEEPSGPGGRRGSVWIWTKAMTITAMGFSTLAVVAAFCIVGPVGVGRKLFSLVGLDVKHDVYPFASGFCLLGIVLEGISRLKTIAESSGARGAYEAVIKATQQACKCAVAGSIILLLSPLLVGVLVDLVIGVPIRVLPNQTPILGTAHHWLIGLLVMKLGVKLIVSSPTLAPRWRAILVDATNQGWRNMRLWWLMRKLAIPIVLMVSTLLGLPYIFSWGLLPWLGVDEVSCWLWWRWSYPATFVSFLVFALWRRVGQLLGQLHDSLRDSLYLVGRRLHNLS